MDAISWIGVGVAALALFVFGALWYGLAFGNLYRTELAVPEPEEGEPAQGANPLFYVLQLATGIVMALVLAWFLGEATVTEGLLAGLAAGVLVAAAHVQLHLAEGKSRTILVMHIGYFIIGLAAAGAVLGAFQ